MKKAFLSPLALAVALLLGSVPALADIKAGLDRKSVG